MVKTVLFIGIWMGLFLPSNGFAYSDSTKCDTCDHIPIIMPDSPVTPLDTNEILFSLTPDFYRDHFGAYTLLDKVTDNFGNGFEDLYGTRNLRPILHGAAYRGGANNYFHRDGRRKNQNPLPEDGVRNLCEQGFSHSVYLYRNNWEETMATDSCDCVNNDDNILNYSQLDYFDDTHVYQMLKMVHTAATDSAVGPVYLHCWNGWHASGYISAVILKQFCKYSDYDAVNYWDLGTDGMNKSPRYQTQRDRIKAFVPYADLMISDSLSDCLCPDMPTDIDSSQLHIDLDHLITVPEAISVGTNIQLTNIKFKPSSSSFSSTVKAKTDLDRVVKAMTVNPGLVLEIGGHTDKSGKSSVNYTLSRQRAKKVYDYLINSGIAAERLTYKGYGPSQPVASNKYRTTRAQNRRIEVKVISKGNEDFTKLVEEENLVGEQPELREPPKEEVIVAPQFAAMKDLLENPAAMRPGDRVLLKTVVFQPYATTLSDPSNKDLQDLLAALKKHPELKVKINGYTDNSGNAVGNRELSNARAMAVYNYLVEQGISKSRLSYQGMGSADPIVSNATRAGRDQNRRIEVHIQ